MSPDERRMLHEIHVRIVGDGSDENPGLSTRVDRLERSRAIFAWLLGTTVAAGCTALGTWIAEWFRRPA